LSAEILILILYSLDLPSLMSCIATNRRVKSLIDSSALLQYRLATQAACVEDNPWNTETNSVQRLTALRKRQTAFAELLPSFIRTIQMDDFPILATYALSGGMFFMAEAEKKALRWTSLASVEQQTPVWERLEIDEYILEFTLAIPEEDLLVVLSSTAPPQFHLATDAIIKLHFYEISTRSAHRRAQESVVLVPITYPIPSTMSPDFEVDICGSRVAVLMAYPGNLVYNPITELIVAQPNHLFIYDWRLGHVPGRIVAGPEISLKLPLLKSSCDYHVTRVEYNPKGNTVATSQQPFHSSFVDSVVVLQVMHIDLAESEVQINDMFLIIPRHALLQQITSTENRPKERLWADWGPPISRWFPGTMFSNDWPTIVCGQRCVFLTRAPSSIVLVDFNPYTRERALLEKQTNGNDNGDMPLTGLSWCLHRG
ncbi:hypothetical protein B0H13DRAFT_1628349, partial [Mycena leptocephala]